MAPDRLTWILAAAMIAAAILGSKLIAPYQIAAAPGGVLYRLNTITGDARQCVRRVPDQKAMEEAKTAGYSEDEILTYLGMRCR
jgi:hypothetical protein